MIKPTVLRSGVPETAQGLGNGGLAWPRQFGAELEEASQQERSREDETSNICYLLIIQECWKFIPSAQ